MQVASFRVDLLFSMNQICILLLPVLEYRRYRPRSQIVYTEGEKES